MFFTPDKCQFIDMTSDKNVFFTAPDKNYFNDIFNGITWHTCTCGDYEHQCVCVHIMCVGMSKGPQEQTEQYKAMMPDQVRQTVDLCQRRASGKANQDKESTELLGVRVEEIKLCVRCRIQLLIMCQKHIFCKASKTMF